MLGKCPACKVRFKQEELKRLVKGKNARCYQCGKLYVTQPFWIYFKLIMMLGIPFGVLPFMQAGILFYMLIGVGLLLVAWYHHLQAYLPLIEENKL